jgi:hypothetical protein
MSITLAAPALIYVRWSCRRCGHTGGMARTTIPFDLAEAASLQAVMHVQLRNKLVRVHANRQGCIALPTDFEIQRVNPHGDRAA